jgi:antitoxin (DNA-binding transcriptional repressor) of toxin-antitoxin stability system
MIVISAGIRELENNLSRYLRELRPGEVIAITDRGRGGGRARSPMAASGAPTPLTAGYARLLERQELTE